MPSWEELGRDLDAQRAAAQRAQREQDAANLVKRQRAEEAKRLVQQFLQAMKLAGNPGLEGAHRYRYWKSVESFKGLGNSQLGITVSTKGDWGIWYQINGEQSSLITSDYPLLETSSLKDLKRGLVMILSNNNVPLPRG